MNRPDLIAQLEKLNPTDADYKGWVPDDYALLQLAPTMRIEILKMAKEIDRLKAEIDKNYKGYKFKKEIPCSFCSSCECTCP